MNKRSAIAAIDKEGALLVFPIDNRRDPHSLWYHFFPKSQMRWEWDEDGDSRVAELWHLREELSRSGKVVYSKWFRNRATFFSRKVFAALLARMQRLAPPASLSLEARQCLEALDESSPLSTKQLKRAVDLQGRFHQSTFEKAMKELWLRGLVVGHGEVDDGAFPSLNMGSTRWMFEELWAEAQELSDKEIAARLKLPPTFRTFFEKTIAKIPPTGSR